MEITSIILKPHLTEKSQKMKESADPVMVFIVNRKANKYQIEVAFQALFGVKPESVNILNRKKSPARITSKSRHNYHKAYKIAMIKVKGQDFSEIKETALKAVQEKKEEEVKVKDGN